MKFQVVHNKAEGTFELSQSKFNLESGLEDSEEFSWWVPNTYASTKEDMMDSSGIENL